jgi:heat shock protein HslJ
MSVKSSWVAMLLLVAPPALGGDAINECWKKSQDRPALGTCLAELRHEEDARLTCSRSDARAVVAGLDAMAGTRQASRNLQRVETAFSLYRDLECHQHELQAGSGSGSGDQFIGCWIELTRARILALEQLMPTDEAQAVVPATLEGTTWVAAEIRGEPTLDGVLGSVSFHAESRASGNSGCNRFQASIEVEQGAVRFGPIAGTRMMCPPAAMDQERRFLAALEGARRLERRGNLLFAYSEAAEPELRLWQRAESPK